MRTQNRTTSRRGAASCPRPNRANAFFARDPPPPSRSSDDGEVQKRGFQTTQDGWLGAAPQVRVRQANDRARAQLGELALLNERLMGQDSWRIRQKVEYLKSKRKAWEGVYNAACKQEISLTVAHLESAMAEVRTCCSNQHCMIAKVVVESGLVQCWVLGCHRVDTESDTVLPPDRVGAQLLRHNCPSETCTRHCGIHALTKRLMQVNEALKEGGDEYQSITDARAELVELLAQVEEAHERLHLTQARVEQNVQKLTELKAEAAEFARLKELKPELPASHPELVAASVPEAVTSAASTQTVGAELAAPSAAAPKQGRQGARGLQSSLNLEPGLRNFWYDLSYLGCYLRSNALISSSSGVVDNIWIAGLRCI